MNPTTEKLLAAIHQLESYLTDEGIGMCRECYSVKESCQVCACGEYCCESCAEKSWRECEDCEGLVCGKMCTLCSQCQLDRLNNIDESEDSLG